MMFDDEKKAFQWHSLRSAHDLCQIMRANFMFSACFRRLNALFSFNDIERKVFKSFLCVWWKTKKGKCLNEERSDSDYHAVEFNHM